MNTPKNNENDAELLDYEPKFKHTKLWFKKTIRRINNFFDFIDTILTVPEIKKTAVLISIKHGLFTFIIYVLCLNLSEAFMRSQYVDLCKGDWDTFEQSRIDCQNTGTSQVFGYLRLYGSKTANSEIQLQQLSREIEKRMSHYDVHMIEKSKEKLGNCKQLFKTSLGNLQFDGGFLLCYENETVHCGVPFVLFSVTRMFTFLNIFFLIAMLIQTRFLYRDLNKYEMVLKEGKRNGKQFHHINGIIKRPKRGNQTVKRRY